MKQESTARLLWILPLAWGLLFSGCSSGGSNGGFLTRALQLNIRWGAINRGAVNSPDSAQSAQIKLAGADPNGGDLTLVAERNGAGPDNPVPYKFPSEVRIGVYTLNVAFYPASGGVASGTSPVGVVNIPVKITSDTLNPITVDVNPSLTPIAAIAVTSGQSVKIGETKALTVTVTDSQGNVLVVAPSALTPKVAAPVPGITGSLTFSTNSSQVQMTGVSAGLVNVTVSASNPTVTSPTAAVCVGTITNDTVTVAQATATVSTGSSLLLTGTEQGSAAPNGAPVIWSVDGGAANGQITQLRGQTYYQAPSNPGTYTVRATGSIDACKSTTETITVTPYSG